MEPRLYSKQAVSLIALLISPFLSCILFAYNLRDVGKGKFGPLFIICGIALPAIVRRVTGNINPLIGLAITNAIGFVALTHYFWPMFFDNYTFEKRNPWPAILIFLGICSIALLAPYLMSKIR